MLNSLVMKTCLTFILLIFCFVLKAQNGNVSAFKKVETTKIPKPIAPAKLVISNLKFNDTKGNNNLGLDAAESAEITFTIKNAGKGEAYESEIILRDKNNTNYVTIGSSKKN